MSCLVWENRLSAKPLRFLFLNRYLNEKRTPTAYFDNLMWAILQCMYEFIVGE